MTQKKKKSRNKITLLLMLFILICLFLVQCVLKNWKEEAEKIPEVIEEKKEVVEEKIVEEKPDTVETIVEDTVQIPIDTIVPKPKPLIKDSVKKKEPKKIDSVKTEEKIPEEIKEEKLPSDTTPPTVSLLPPPGRYYEPIKLKAKCDEIKCASWVSFGDTLNPIDAKKGVEYNKTGVVFFRAQDSSGNYSEWFQGDYDMASDNRCGKNAYPVPVGGKEICVDAYEYPNKEGEVARDMVSQEQAATLCANEGKRLCTITEWQAACRGKDSFKFSYGNSYIPARCNTNTSSALRAGRKNQCRSWWGMYDMNGNLWEWTSTKSKEKESAFLVAGGSWSANAQSRCSETSYSFYPQNQYPSVGFRCCKD